MTDLNGAEVKSTREDCADPHAIATQVWDFVRQASTEIAPHDERLLGELAPILPAGMAVYVAHTPKAAFEDVARAAIKLQSLGFNAAPHLVARRLPSEAALSQALSRLRDAGIEQVLLVAGDLERPLGPFASTLEIIDTGLLQHFGIKRIGVAGHPDGHRAIAGPTLLEALRYKHAFANRTGLSLHIVTQFGFDPAAVCAWAQHLSKEGIDLPIHVGIAGPTPLPKLLKFAMHCGVRASLQSFGKNMGAMANLARGATSPEEMLLGLLQARAVFRSVQIVQPHFYAFGGTLATALWLRTVMDGNFQIQRGARKFSVR